MIYVIIVEFRATFKYYELRANAVRRQKEIKEVFGNWAERVEYRGPVLEHSTY